MTDEALLSEALKALPDPDKLELLAEWFDMEDSQKDYQRGGEVQRDLRQWAHLARKTAAKLEERLLQS